MSLQQVHQALLQLQPKNDPKFVAHYVGADASALRFLGHSSPQLDSLLKQGFAFSKSNDLKTIRAWDTVWKKSPYYEALSLALSFIDDEIPKEELIRHWPMLKTWADRIDNWAHSDGLSKLYAYCLETNPKLLLPVLKRWGDSTNPWKRRLSIVSLIYFASSRKKVLPFSQLFKQVEKQLRHPDIYVQKGVGWTLRELWNCYPKKTLETLRPRIGLLSAIAFSIATEKMPLALKEPLKQKRKSLRKEKKTAKSLT